MNAFKYPRRILAPLLNHLRKEEQDLLKRKKELESEDPFADESRLNDNASDDIEAAEQWGHQRAEALGEHLEEALGRIKKAINRINNGTFGHCVSCGEMINTDRLSIDPTAELCIDCAKKKSKQ